MAKTSNEIIKSNGYKFKVVVIDGVKKLIPDIKGNIKLIGEIITNTTKKVAKSVNNEIMNKINKEVDTGVNL